MPTGLLVCGGSGAGKSSHLQEIVKDARMRSFLLIDPDKMDAPNHVVASKMAFESVYETIRQRKNFAYVGTCAGTRGMHDILRTMRDYGYRIVVAIVHVSLPTAIERVRARKEQPVPEKVVRELYDYFKKGARNYLKFPEIDELFLYSNDPDFMQLGVRKEGIWTISERRPFYFTLPSEGQHNSV